jgi:predicted metal-binding membrane protein
MTAGLRIVRGGDVGRNEHAVVAVSSLLFAVSATVTIAWCASMSAMGGMPMPGGWTMSMAWMRMPGETWAGAAASWLGMWIVMMVAMMLPSLVPMLSRYREAVFSGPETRLGLLTVLAGVGYFSVWTLIGIVTFPLGFALADAGMQYAALSRTVPFAVGVIVLIAGSCQFTAWKAHHLACCRGSSAFARGNPGELRRDGLERRRTLPANAAVAWRYGVRLGFHCSCCSAGLTAILLVMGVMDLRVMAVVATAITAERLAPAGERVAQSIGIIVVCAGVLLLARAAGLH